MCRSRAEGGRRCPGSHAGSRDTSERESYAGTRWQGYDEAAQRGEEIHRRHYEGESITDIMSSNVAKRAEARIAQIAREGW